MDPEVIQKGRSYSGVGFICKEQIGVSYRTIDVNSDRVCCIQTLSKASVILTVIGVYMRYNNTSCNSVQLYVELLEILQDLIDTFAANSPIIILGDFNASLPQKKQLGINQGLFLIRVYCCMTFYPLIIYL